MEENFTGIPPRPIPKPRKSLNRNNNCMETKGHTAAHDPLSNPRHLIPPQFSESPQSSLILDCLNESVKNAQRPRYSLERLVPIRLIGVEGNDPVPLTSADSDMTNSTRKAAQNDSVAAANVQLDLCVGRQPDEFSGECVIQHQQLDAISPLIGNSSLSSENQQQQHEYDGLHQFQIASPPPGACTSREDNNSLSSSDFLVAPQQRSQISLLEKLVKTTHIWFLPHLSRSFVAHILGPQPPGTFIVRSTKTTANSRSTNGGQTMDQTATLALSIRMPAGNGAAIDHYIIEALGAKVVKIRGSPNHFASLSELIHHYCLNSEELRIKLTLPGEIISCSTIQELQALDLMGEDFWASNNFSYDAPRNFGYKSNEGAIDLSLSHGSSLFPISQPLYCGVSTHMQPPSNNIQPQNLQNYYQDSPSTSCSPAQTFQQGSLRRSLSTSGTFDQQNYCCIPSLALSAEKPQIQSLGRQKPKKTGGISFLRSIFSSTSLKGQSKSSTLPFNSSRSFLLDNGSPHHHHFHHKCPIQKQQYLIDDQRNYDLKSLHSQQQSSAKRIQQNDSFLFSPHNVHRCSIPENDCLTFNPSAADDSILSPSKKLSQNEIEARQAAFRRMNTDLCHSSIASRLAHHNHLDYVLPSKPPPPTLPKPKAKSTHRFGLAAADLLSTHENGSTTRNTNSPESLRSCLFDTRSEAFNRSLIEKNRDKKKDYFAKPKMICQQSGKFSQQSKECDAISIATEFNEPWDSNIWDNLMNIASIGDQNVNLSSTLRSTTTQSSGSRAPINFNSKINDKVLEECNLDFVGTSTPLRNREQFFSPSSAEEVEEGRPLDDELQNTEEAVAMAVVLAGTGTDTLAQKSKSRKNEWIKEIEIQAPKKSASDSSFYNGSGQKVKDGTNSDATLESLLLVENAAKMASIARNNGGRNPAQKTLSQSSFLSQPRTETLHVPPSLMMKKDESQKMLSSQSSAATINNIMRIKILPQTMEYGNSTFNTEADDEDNKSELTEPSADDMATHIYTLALPAVSPPRLRCSSESPVKVIKDYIGFISQNQKTIFGATLCRFIECTQNSREKDPYIVIRRIRQFLTGLKNYLVKNGEAELHSIIQQQSERLFANEFLNIDAIIEDILCKILLKRLKPQLYRLMNLEITKTGELGKFSEQLLALRMMCPAEFGFPDDMIMPEQTIIEKVGYYLKKMQNHYSPLKKLEVLLKVISLVVPVNIPENKCLSPNSTISNNINHSIGSVERLNLSSRLQQPPAEELIRWLVYIFARNLFINCEVEAWYIWELLPQQVLTTGNSAYYLSTLFSAIHVIKNPDSLKRLRNCLQDDDMTGSRQTMHEDVEVSDAFLRVAVPNETGGTIEYHTFPVLPKITSSKLCKMIANQFAITNPGDFDLYVLCDGFETQLKSNELPYLIRDRLCEAGKQHLFAYKRNDIRIAWPKQGKQSCF